MSQAINYGDAILRVEVMVEDGWSKEDIFNYFSEEEGLTKKQIYEIFVQSGLSEAHEKVKTEEVKRRRQTLEKDETNPLEEALGGLLSLAIKYGLPLLLMVFGTWYVVGVMSNNFENGVRSAAAIIMPLAITLAFSRSDVSLGAVNFLSQNKFVAFGLAFAVAMSAAAAGMQLREMDNLVPVGELAFSTTLAMLIFSNKTEGDVPYIHIGAVSGFLTYVVLFGV